MQSGITFTPHRNSISNILLKETTHGRLLTQTTAKSLRKPLLRDITNQTPVQNSLKKPTTTIKSHLSTKQPKPVTSSLWKHTEEEVEVMPDPPKEVKPDLDPIFIIDNLKPGPWPLFGGLQFPKDDDSDSEKEFDYISCETDEETFDKGKTFDSFLDFDLSAEL